MDKLKLSEIRLDGGTQPRVSLRQDIVDEYALDMQRGDSIFPPVDVFYDGTNYWLADGFHRYQAAKKLGLVEIGCNVHQGRVREAILFSAGANARHGFRRSNADKQRQVEMLLKDDEWSKWADNAIARRCDVYHSFVSKIRSSLAQPSAPRLVQRGNQQYTMKPRSPIGHSSPAPKPTPDKKHSSPPQLRFTMEERWMQSAANAIADAILRRNPASSEDVMAHLDSLYDAVREQVKSLSFA